MADVMRFTATQVQPLVIADAGHWIIEEQPATLVKAVRTFLDARVPH
jgi:pimeloyl-ACP methyl ester carboxylesterase